MLSLFILITTLFIMSDEAHRSQYGVFADNMMKLLPTAARIGFTGTPLLSSDNIIARMLVPSVGMCQSMTLNEP